MKHIFFILCGLITYTLHGQNIRMTNPLLKRSTLQYQAPRFDLIKDGDFKPALEYAMKLHKDEIMRIVNNTQAPTFANTLIALEKSGEDLNRITNILYNLTSANTNEQLQEVEAEFAPKLSAHFDEIYLNSTLYKKIKGLNSSLLKGEDKRLYEYYIQQFEIAGAALSEDKKAKLKKINEELATLSTAYSNKLLTARKGGTVYFTSESDLDGLSKEEIDAAKEKAKADGKEGQYAIGLINTTQQPALTYLTKRESREKLFKASWMRAEKNDEGDTRALIEKMAKLRLQKAQLLGKKNFAEWKLQDQMAKNPKTAMDLIQSIAKPAVAKAKEEAAEIQKLIDAQGGGFKLEPWDWNFYSEQIRKAKYAVDEATIKPYFDVRVVLEKGVFFAAERMYGITFKQRNDLPLYHPDVVAYEVFDRDGKSMAIYYLDFYTRDNKSGGAWMNNYVNQSYLLKQKPVIVNVFNFAKPTEGNPSLISWDDVTTMFHEFGHTLHGLFASQKYQILSGTATPRDYVEFPSQINEHAAIDPEILANYAIHYQTKKPIPSELIEKLKKAETFNKGYEVTELLAAAALDLAWHSVTEEKELGDVLDFEKKALTKMGLYVKEVPTRYHTPYFNHIWGGGYSAGYYAYTWSKTLDYSAYDWFMNNGGLTRANCDRFRKYILSIGNSKDLGKAFRDFIGRDMSVQSYLKNAGLN